MIGTILNYIMMYFDIILIVWGANCTLIGIAIIGYGKSWAKKEYMLNQYYREVARSVGRKPSEAGSAAEPKKDTVRKDLQIGFIVVGVTMVLLGVFRLTQNKIYESMQEREKAYQVEQMQSHAISIGHNYDSLDELLEDLNNR